MEPQIQYVTTSDGVNIAYYTMGEGNAWVIAPMPIMSHLQLEWEDPVFRQTAERMAENRQVVKYDGRGAGLSDRSITDYSIEALVMDLETVVDHLDLERFDLFGMSRAGLVAVSYAAKHPDRISNLILLNASTTDVWGSRALHAARQLVEQDWEFFVDTYIEFLNFPEDQKDRAASLMKASTSAEAILGIDSAFEGVDVGDLLGKVQAPTLVIQPPDAAKIDGLANARQLASGIPDARLAITGPATLARSDLAESVARIIEEFLGFEAPEPASTHATTANEVGGFRTILFTDVEGSTALTERLGDAKARDLLREHEQMIRAALNEHGGSEVKTMGDGFMAFFTSASKALDCAIAIQSAFAKRNESADEPIKVRVGLNAGEPIAEDEDLFGTAVNMAARIAAKAEGGEVLASNVVRELVAGKGFMFGDRGETELRGFEDAVRLYEVRWREGGDSE